MTNLEGRVVLRRRAVAPPPGVRTDIEIITGLAAALGKSRWFPYASPRDVFDELRAASRGGPADYSGITYERIAAEDGVFWPCPALDHPGTPRLFVDRFPTPGGRARFHATPHQDMAEARNDDYPLYLTTGRLLAQYQSGNQTRRVEDLNRLTPEPLAEMHPAAARRAGVAEGGRVTLRTRRSSASYTVRLTKTIREDTVFVPFHWGGHQSANRLTNAALDPSSRMPEFKACAARAEPADAADGSDVPLNPEAADTP